MDNIKKEEMKANFLEFIAAEGAGNVLFTCQKFGYNRQTLYGWQEEDLSFKHAWDKAVSDGRSSFADEAELGLRRLVRKGNVTAIIFSLKNLRPEKWKDKWEVKDESEESYIARLVEELKTKPVYPTEPECDKIDLQVSG